LSSLVLSFGRRCLGLFSSARGWPRILFYFGILCVSCRLRLSFPHGLLAAGGLRLLSLELIHRSGCRSRFVLRPWSSAWFFDSFLTKLIFPLGAARLNVSPLHSTDKT
jgi:hypothetical protein